MNRLVVVSNRVPLPDNNGATAGGLAVALEALMAQRGGVWFGWSGKISEEQTGEPALLDHNNIQYATVDLTEEQHNQYYNDFSNGVLWPLLHSMPNLMQYDRESAVAYRAVNEMMASSLVPLLKQDDTIWLHDYHLLPMASLLRDRGVRSPIGFFLHIPFPTPDLLATMPDATVLLADLMHADLLGFQTEQDRENFANAATSLGKAVEISANCLKCGDRVTRLGVFPVEIESQEFAAVAKQSLTCDSSRKLRSSLTGQALVLGVDRMDPTKGIPQRLAGFRRLLENHPEMRRKVTFLQISAPSREHVPAYVELRHEVEEESGSLNSQFAEPDWTPLRLIGRAGDRAVVAGYMRQARACLVTPLRDGMNLVAKEYIAAQDPEDPGVLILSRFAGAVHQLKAALVVNPYDPEEIGVALHQALTMDREERKQRWRACWNAIADRSGMEWGENFLKELTSPPAAATTSASKSSNSWENIRFIDKRMMRLTQRHRRNTQPTWYH